MCIRDSFIHYLAYTVILILDTVWSSHTITYFPGFQSAFRLHKPLGNLQMTYRSNDETQSSGFREKKREYRALIKSHYLRNTLFFYAGCLCAVAAGSKVFAIVLIYVVIVEKGVEIYAVYNDYMWLAYVGHILGCVVNYINIISAIAYAAEE
eukprot:TRINITY_DN3768_c0_g1_i5.p4 TRINITY_DN3768_c0_g1~~TRINITY_DN3768_c0_g1_i5.p4  ORF type:complete len:152 (+),score=34.54 TRINITY_DN3768_c0_g1_i5:74-529(+)